MEASLLWMIVLQITLIILNAIFACAEIAVISMNDAKLAKLAAQGDKRAIRLARLTNQPARFLATIQVAITLSGFLGSAFAAENFSDELVQLMLSLGLRVSVSTLDAISVIVITLILSYFTLVFGELVPKRIAMRKAEALALGMSALVTTIARIFAPLVWLLTASTNGMLRLLGIDPNAEDDSLSEEEIRMMVDVGSERGAIDHAEKEFIQNVFEFDDLTAGEVATHRTDVALLWLEEPMDAWKATIYGSHFNLYPVCHETADHIIGILNAKDYFRLEDQSRESVMEKAVRPAYFVPESVMADVLFRNMKHARHKMAVVLDEFGGMTGIITMNDLVQQLVGDLGVDGPARPVRAAIEQIDETSWRVHGSADLEALQKALGIRLPAADYGTFNGLVFASLGLIPQDGTQIDLSVAGLAITVREIRAHQVEEAVVRRVEQA